MTLGKLTLAVWIWFGLMSAGFLPLCMLASQVPGPYALHVVLYVLIIGVLWWGAFGYGMYLGQAMQNGDKRVLKHGIQGMATVLESKGTHTYIGGAPDMGYGGSRVYRYRLRVELPGQEPYETYTSMTNHGLRQWDRVPVGVARFNRRRVAVDFAHGPIQHGSSKNPSFTGSSVRTVPAPRQRDRHPSADPDLVLMERPASAPKVKRPRTPEDAIPLEFRGHAAAEGHGHLQGRQQDRQHGRPDEGERLRQLSELGRLHKEGVLSDEEFAAEKARILGFSS